MRNFRIVFIIVVFTVSAIFAQHNKHTADKSDYENNFRNQYGKNWKISWNTETGTVSDLTGGEIPLKNGLNSFENVKRFLVNNYELFGIKDFDMNMSLTRTNGNENDITYFCSQTVNGIPVVGAGYSISVTGDGKIYHLAGCFYPELDFDTKPTIDKSIAEDLVKNDFKADSSIIKKSQLMIINGKNESLSIFNLVYSIVIWENDHFNRYRYLIDANTGSILLKEDEAEYITGTGNVYLVNPYSTFWQSEDLNSLDDLTPRLLQGTHVEVFYYGTNNPEASSITGEFLYSPGNDHFDEVMAYYHIDNCLQWLICTSSKLIGLVS